MAFHLTEVDLGISRSSSKSATLISEAAYHLDELVPIAMALSERDIAPRLLLVEATAGWLRRLRSAHRRYQRSVDALASMGFGLTKTGISSDEVRPADALVVMNDWGPSKALVHATQGAGGVAFGKIEGAQDFADVDTGSSRNAYRSVDVVLCQGDNDLRAMAGAECHVVGNARIEKIMSGPVRSDRSGPAIINSNFSYGQLAEHRRAWLRSAFAGCSQASLPYRVSRHPADLGLIAPWKTTSTRIEDAIQTAPALISRFSSVCFEALAQGVPVAYFNPHGEKAEPFDRPEGAFETLRSSDELADYLRRVQALSATDVRANAVDFLAKQVDVATAPSGERAADVIASRVS